MADRTEPYDAPAASPAGPGAAPAAPPPPPPPPAPSSSSSASSTCPAAEDLSEIYSTVYKLQDPARSEEAFVRLLDAAESPAAASRGRQTAALHIPSYAHQFPALFDRALAALAAAAACQDRTVCNTGSRALHMLIEKSPSKIGRILDAFAGPLAGEAGPVAQEKLRASLASSLTTFPKDVVAGMCGAVTRCEAPERRAGLIRVLRDVALGEGREVLSRAHNARIASDAIRAAASALAPAAPDDARMLSEVALALCPAPKPPGSPGSAQASEPQPDDGSVSPSSPASAPSGLSGAGGVAAGGGQQGQAAPRADSLETLLALYTRRGEFVRTSEAPTRRLLVRLPCLGGPAEGLARAALAAAAVVPAPPQSALFATFAHLDQAREALAVLGARAADGVAAQFLAHGPDVALVPLAMMVSELAGVGADEREGFREAVMRSAGATRSVVVEGLGTDVSREQVERAIGWPTRPAIDVLRVFPEAGAAYVVFADRRGATSSVATLRANGVLGRTASVTYVKGDATRALYVSHKCAERTQGLVARDLERLAGFMGAVPKPLGASLAVFDTEASASRAWDALQVAPYSSMIFVDFAKPEELTKADLRAVIDARKASQQPPQQQQPQQQPQQQQQQQQQSDMYNPEEDLPQHTGQEEETDDKQHAQQQQQPQQPRQDEVQGPSSSGC
eukprot:m51a1_g11509 hypothetical protein (679) ;mRNA; r:343-3160